MKRVIAVGLMVFLSGCGGGFDDMDAARPGGGIGNTGSDNNQPGTPEEKTQWQYSSISSADRVFSLKATNYALNFFYDPKSTNKTYRPWVELERRQSSSGAVTDTVTVFVNSTLSCTPSCNVNMIFDGQRATYQMQNSTDGIIKPLNDVTEKALFNKLTTSNRATISLPVVGLSAPFDANFDLHGYDINKMTF